MRNLFAKPDDADVAAETVSSESDPLEGISQTDCAYACTAESCCIVGAPICSHPNKGGLQAKFMSDPGILRRFNRAKQLLAQTNLARRADRDDRFLNGDTNV